MVGGCSRIPQVQKLVSDYFSGKSLNKQVNPDEAIAYGAAIYASILSGANAQDITLMDITPLSLGIKVVGNKMNIIIPRNTKVPISIQKKYSTGVDNQKEVSIQIYEGERE